MVSATFILVAGALLALYYYFSKKDKRMSKFPAGPMAYPIFGNAIQMGENPSPVFSEWAKKYGPTYGIKLGGDRAVVLHDVKTIREMFNEPAFSGRATTELFVKLSGGNYGVLNSNGATWEAQRRFTLRHLRDFGFGKNSMEQLIMEEVREIVDWMKKEEGHPLEVNRKFSLAVLNSLWMILSGKRFDQHDTTLNDLLDSTNKEFANTMKNPIVLFAPWLCKWAPEITGLSKLESAIDQLVSFFKKTVKEQEFRNEDNPSDFMEYYSQEIKKTTDPNSTFYKNEGEKNLLAIVGDLFQAGSETTSTTLSWEMLYLVREQEIQRKLQEEIDAVVGKSRCPSLSDRPNMPYTEAVIMEVLRYSSMVPIGVFHLTLFDKEFDGHFFPKGTWLIPHLYHIHHSKEIWGDPENFRPERFIKNGKLISKPDAFLPFLVGKRACIGESLAKDSLFLFTVSIFQRFNVCPDPANPKPTIEPALGFIRQPLPFTVVMKDRIEA